MFTTTRCKDRFRLRAIALLAVFWGLTGIAADWVGIEARERPNVLLITIDALRADRLSAYGYERATSPNLDRLIGDGVRFTEARTVEPLTNPALASMITGLYPHQHGGSRNGLRLHPGLASLPKALKVEGYKTAAFVSNWTLRDKISGLGEHFDVYSEVLTRSRWFGLVRREANAEDVTSRSLDWLEEHQREEVRQPFLLWAHYVEPHAPYRLQKEHLAALKISKNQVLSDSDRYDTEIASVDQSIGALLAGIEELELTEKTIIIFAADHGESLGEHKYWGHGRNLYDPSLRIPMSITWPDRITAQDIDAPALIIDLPPTILGLLGRKPLPEFEGYDWTAVLNGAEPPAERITRYQAHRGAVTSRHESDRLREAGLLEVGLIRAGRKETYRISKERTRLYELAADPGELIDLTEPKHEPTAELLEWMRLVYRGLASLDAVVPEPLDDESVEQLRLLGYVD